MLPAFTDSTFTSRPGRSRSTTSSSRARFARRGARARRRRITARRLDARHGLARRDWAEHPTAAALDAVTGDTPAALWSKDYHSLWLNSAALALAGGDLEVPGGVVERDADGEPTGDPARGVGLALPRTLVTVAEDEWVDATREGIRIANARGVAAIHDKDGWLGAPRSSAASTSRKG